MRQPQTINRLKLGPRASYPELLNLVDFGARRFNPYSFDSDTSALALEPPGDDWDEAARIAHQQSRENYISQLREEYGTRKIDQVIANLRALGPKSMSLITYHNDMYDQARQAFTVEAYYPALVASCALGERILNHLLLDLKDDFSSTPEYGKIHRKKSFQNWSDAIDVLSRWEVLLPGVTRNFEELSKLRNESIHFNLEIYGKLREDALKSLQLIGAIISEQFGYFGRQPWFISGTPGAQFIKRDFETNPFVRRYLIPVSSFVGPLYGMKWVEPGYFRLFDYSSYGDLVLDDDEFAKAYRERDPESVVTIALEKGRDGKG